MFTWFVLKKLGNASRAEIIGVADASWLDHLNQAGTSISSRNFTSIPADEHFEALIDVKTNSGRRFVRRTRPLSNGRQYVMVEQLKETVTNPMPKQQHQAKEVLSGYYISPEARLIFNTALGMLKNNPKRPVKVLVVGPSGYGKTTLPRLVAELTDMEFKRMNCATIRDPEEWFGFREAVKGSTVFIESDFAKKFQAGNLVMVLDEFNRLEPWLHNTLFPLLDDDGRTVVHDQEFVIGEGVLVVATINQGYRFTGTFELDEALVNRFDFVLEVGELPDEEEERVLVTRTGIKQADAALMVRLATSLRQAGAVCSVRTTLLMANMMVSGMTMREAVESAVIRRIPQEGGGSANRKAVVDLVNSKIGILSIRNLVDDIFSTGTVVDAGPRVVARISLGNVAKASINFVGLIAIVRELPLYGKELSLKETRELLEGITQGKSITLRLSQRLINQSVLEQIEDTGATCAYEEL